MLKLQSVALLLLLTIAVTPAAAAAPPPPLIPLPVSATWRDGAFPITAGTVVEGKGAAAPTAEFLSRALGIKAGKGGASRVRLLLVPDKEIQGDEAYRLTATSNEIRIEASHAPGLFYGAQTLRQLVTSTAKGVRTIPAVTISDWPRFKWRGLLIDVSRHFFGKPTMLKIIDEMAAYKLNVLQLHLTDDPGWRLEIAGYPKLTEIGSLGDATRPQSGVRQYFTAADIRDIVAYAAERHIVVVPEIEMPGHAGSGGRSYPQFYDRGRAFNPAKPETYSYIHDVLAQVAKLFPGPVIHFGGDEVADDTWNGAPEVDRLKSEHGLKTTDDVEAYFGRRVAQIIHDVGKRPMAWDEQAEAGASKDVVIHFWRKDRPDVLRSAANAGYDLVLSPVDRTYFDYTQGPGEPGAPWEGNDGGPISIAKILSWEPVPDDFTPAQTAQVLGIEAAVWTEFIESERYLQFMTFPRLLAFAEVGWRPRGPRDQQEFERRLQPHTDALRARGIYARRESWDAADFLVN